MHDPTQSRVVWGQARGLLRAMSPAAGRYGSNIAVCPDPRGGAVVTVGWGQESGLDLWAGAPLQVTHAITIASEPGDEDAVLPAWSMPVAARSGWTDPSHLLPAADAMMALRAARMVVAAGRTLHLFDFPMPGSGFVHAGALEGHPDAVVRTGISTDGLRVVGAMPSGEVWLWDVSTQTLLHRLTQTQQPHWTGFLWNDLLVGVGDGSGRVVIWEAASGRRHMQFDAHAGPVLGVAASSERGALLTFGADGVARQWDLDEGRQLARDIVHGASICGACFAAGGKAIVTLDVAGRLAVTNAADGKLLDWVQLEPNAGGRLAVDRITSAIWVGDESHLTSVEADWAALLALRPTHRNSNSGRFAPLAAETPMRPAFRTVGLAAGVPVPAAPLDAATDVSPVAAAAIVPPVQPAQRSSGGAHAPTAHLHAEANRPSSGVAPHDQRDQHGMKSDGPARLPSTGSQAGAAWQPAEPDRFRVGADSIVGMSPIPLLSHGARVMPSSGALPVIAPVAEFGDAGAAPFRRPAPPTPLLSSGARVMPSSVVMPLIAPVAEVDASAAARLRKPAPPVAYRAPSAVHTDPLSTGSARREAAPSTIVDQIRASQIIWQESARQSRREVRTTIFVAILAGFIAAAVTWYYFAYSAAPAAVQMELERLQQNQTETVAQANALFENYEREQRAASARYREDATILPTEVERLQRISERRIEERRARRDQTVLEGQARLQVAQAELAEQRRELAKRLAVTGGLIIAAAAALLAFFVQLGSREKPGPKLGVDRR